MSEHNRGLSSRHLRQVTNWLPDLYSLRDVAELPPVLLKVAFHLITCRFCTLNELNLHTGAISASYHPAAARELLEPLMTRLRLRPYIDQHPVYNYVLQTGDSTPRTISDFLTNEDWLATDFGKNLATFGVRDVLYLCLRHPPRGLVFLALNRDQRDFKEEDRQVAVALLPHLIQAYDNATAYTQARAFASLAVRTMNDTMQGVVFLDDHGVVTHMNIAAQALLDRYFRAPAGWRSRIPEPLQLWLQQRNGDNGHNFEQTSGEFRLIVTATSGDHERTILLLQEQGPVPGPERLRLLGLSLRQAEVLHWLAIGRSNPDIAKILHISARTVDKHCEAIFEKLGAANRVEAALIALRIGQPAA